jgi:hypothetical protein
LKVAFFLKKKFFPRFQGWFFGFESFLFVKITTIMERIINSGKIMDGGNSGATSATVKFMLLTLLPHALKVKA